MLKNNYFFILVFLMCSFVACEDVKKEVEESCPQSEVTGGEVAGGVPTADMGLEGGQSSDQESQPTGGSAEEEDPQGGELAGGAEELPSDEEEPQGGSEEVSDPLPTGGAQLQEEEPVEGGEVAPEEDVPAVGGSLVEEEESEG